MVQRACQMRDRWAQVGVRIKKGQIELYARKLRESGFRENLER